MESTTTTTTTTTTILEEPDTAARSTKAKAAGWLDLCHVGVALRALIAVHAVGAIGAMFVAASWTAWIDSVTVAAAVATPGTLAWLVATCVIGRIGSQWSPRLQGLAAVLLGVVCAMAAEALLHGIGAGPFGLGLGVPLAGAALAAGFVGWLQLRARAQVPAQATARIQELQARIRPHFLFNTLNTAIALVRSDPGRAEDVLEDLADLFRAALADDGAPSTLGAEIEIARRYLDIEHLRFGPRLAVHWSIDPLAASARVPPLLLQPLVENAVRHGIEPSETGGEIRIRTVARGDRALLRVANSLSQAPSQPGHGIGLESVRRRLLLMHDVQARFAAGVRRRFAGDGAAAPDDAAAAVEDEFRVDIAVPLSR